MLFHIYLFVLLAGIGIGSVEYIRWCERSLPTSADIPPEIALTFDDGPHPVYTKKLLDGLRKRGVKATFFLIGEDIVKNMKHYTVENGKVHRDVVITVSGSGRGKDS